MVDQATTGLESSTIFQKKIIAHLPAGRPKRSDASIIAADAALQSCLRGLKAVKSVTDVKLAVESGLTRHAVARCLKRSRVRSQALREVERTLSGVNSIRPLWSVGDVESGEGVEGASDAKDEHLALARKAIEEVVADVSVVHSIPRRQAAKLLAAVTKRSASVTPMYPKIVFDRVHLSLDACAHSASHLCDHLEEKSIEVSIAYGKHGEPPPFNYKCKLPGGIGRLDFSPTLQTTNPNIARKFARISLYRKSFESDEALLWTCSMLRNLFSGVIHGGSIVVTAYEVAADYPCDASRLIWWQPGTRFRKPKHPKFEEFKDEATNLYFGKRRDVMLLYDTHVRAADEWMKYPRKLPSRYVGQPDQVLRMIACDEHLMRRLPSHMRHVESYCRLEHKRRVPTAQGNPNGFFQRAPSRFEKGQLLDLQVVDSLACFHLLTAARLRHPAYIREKMAAFGPWKEVIGRYARRSEATLVQPAQAYLDAIPKLQRMLDALVGAIDPDE